MVLKGRLGLIAKKADYCKIVCDIGTDHAYIPIYLVRKGICKKVIATDIKKGPVYIARNNISKYGLESFIETRTGYGLKPLEENELDTIIIAGMGGMLIIDILADGYEKARKAYRLILQPMNAVEVVREWLYQNRFSILDEELACEGEKIYNVIVAKWTNTKVSCEKLHCIVGKKLIEKKDPLLEKYIEKKVNELDKIINGLKKSKDENNKIKEYTVLKNELCLLIGRRDSIGRKM